MSRVNYRHRAEFDATCKVAKTKTLIIFAVTAMVICAFVFAYAKRLLVFSHDGTHILKKENNRLTEVVLICNHNQRFSKSIILKCKTYKICSMKYQFFPCEIILRLNNLCLLFGLFLLVPYCQSSFFHLGFWSGNFVLIVHFPDRCLLVLFHHVKTFR